MFVGIKVKFSSSYGVQVLGDPSCSSQPPVDITTEVAF